MVDAQKRIDVVPTNNELYKQKSWLSFQYHIKGLSQSEIGEIFDVSQTTIKYWMEKQNIKSRGPAGLKEPNFDMDRCIELYKSGLGSRRVADKLDVDRSSVRRWLKEKNIDIHSSGMKKVNDELENKIVKLYDNGLTQKEISNKDDINVGQATISRVLRESDIDTRNKAGFGQICYSNGGIEVKSKLEQICANWLESNKKSFEYEPDIDKTDYIPDFVVGDKIVEVWGIKRSKKYDERRKMKIKEYNELGYDVFSVGPEYKQIESKLSDEFNGGEK